MSNERLIAALEEQARVGATTPSTMEAAWDDFRAYSSLKPSAPPVRASEPPEPPQPPTTVIVPAEPSEAPVPATGAPEAVRVWRLTADIGVWRRPKNR